MRFCLNSSVSLCVLLALVSCSRSKTVTHEELRSDFISAISLAAETELFVAQVQGGRVTRSFGKSHFGYLRDEAIRSAKELREAHADAKVAQSLEACYTQLDSLAAELAALKANASDQASLSARKERIARIRSALEHAKDKL